MLQPCRSRAGRCHFSSVGLARSMRARIACRELSGSGKYLSGIVPKTSACETMSPLSGRAIFRIYKFSFLYLRLFHQFPFNGRRPPNG